MNTNIKSTRLFLATVILLDFMGMATVVVTFPHLFLDAGGHFLPEAWSSGFKTIFLGITLAVYPLGQFFGAMVFGKLSDAHGRQQILSLTILLTVIGFILSGVAVQISDCWMLLLSRLFTGLAAGNVAVAQAGLVDISRDEKEKIQNITLGQMSMGSGYIVGPVVGAFLGDASNASFLGPATPFYFFAGTLLLALFYCWKKFAETLATPSASTAGIAQEIRQLIQGFQNRHLRLGFLTWFAFASGWWLFESFMPTFILQRFNFSTTQIGNLLAFNGLLYVSFQHFVIKKIAEKMSATQMFGYSAVLAGASIMAVPYVHTVAQLYATMVLFVTSMGFAIPGLITAVSQRAAADEQGKVMGNIGSIQALATILGMALGGALNSIDIDIPLLLGGGFVVISWMLFVVKFGVSKGPQAA